jgi:uncharacterized membrane protein
VSPFDIRSVLFAKHAQHVVLIHFPIALFLMGVVFDLVAQRTKNAALAAAAYYNISVAAVCTLPVTASGILAWQFALDGAPLRKTLLWHLLLGVTVSILIWIVAYIHQRARRNNGSLPAYRWAVQLVAAGLLGLTAHLGGFLSGVNT